MKIAKLQIEKFRAIESSVIEFGHETALVGQNSAGKSSILRALNAFFNFQKEKQAFEEGRHAFQKTTTSIIILDFSEVPKDCKLARITNGSNKVRIRLRFKRKPIWHIFTNGKWVPAPNNTRELISNNIRYVYIPMKRDHEISAWGDTGLLQQVVESWLETHTQNRDRITPKVTKLGNEIKKNAFDKLSNRLRELTPSKANFTYALEYDPSPNYSLFIRDLVLNVVEGNTKVDLQDCGSGTQSMAAFGVYSYLAELEGNNYVLGIEEPEQNLHPHAQRELINSLRQLPLQVIFTTHSTVMVDELKHEAVVLCRRAYSKKRSVVVTTKQIKNEFWADAGISRECYYDFHRKNNSDFFFASYVVVVEGSTDLEVIKHLLNEVGINQSTYAVSIVSLDGVNSLPYIYKLLRELEVHFSVVVDKDYFLQYLNDKREASLDTKGFPKYKREFKPRTLLDDMVPDESKKIDLLNKFNLNHSRAMKILAEANVYCFKYALEVDLVASSKARELLYTYLNVPVADRSESELLIKRYNKGVKPQETILYVLKKLPKKNYPNSYKRIQNSLPKSIKKTLF